MIPSLPIAFAFAVASLASPDCPHGVVVEGVEPNTWKRAASADPAKLAADLVRFGMATKPAAVDVAGAKIDLWKAALWTGDKRDFVVQVRSSTLTAAFALHPIASAGAAASSWCSVKMPFVAPAISGQGTTTFSFENVVDAARQVVRVFTSSFGGHESAEETSYWELQDAGWTEIFDVTATQATSSSGSATQTAVAKTLKSSTWPKVIELRQSTEECGATATPDAKATCARSDSVVRFCYGPTIGAVKKYVPCAR